MRSLFCTAIVASLFTLGAAPSPQPSATPNPLSSFSAAGWVSLRAVNKDKIATITAEIQFAHSGLMTRIDLGDVSATANNGKGEVAKPFPEGMLSVVIDQAKGLFTVWSSRRPLYYESKFALSTWNAANAFNETSAFTKYQVLGFSLNLTGHQIVDGHMASIFELTSKVQKQGGRMQNTVGHVAFADDLSGLPIHEDLTIGPGEPSTVTLQADLTRVSPNPPPASDFSVPSGYKKTSNFIELLMTLAPTPPPKPKP
jgi:hypothetical protein